MSKRFPVAKWTLPDVINPPDSICITVPVPNNRLHIAAFFGALYNLTSARFWQDDIAHTALDVAHVWQDIFDELAPGACDFIAPDLIEEMEYQMSICEQLRWQDGKLQALCCGEWTDIPGVGPAIGGTVTQPGAGGDLAPGECKTYTVVLDAKNKWLVPVKVGANYKITITGATGATTDGNVNWFCPDGSDFILGACISGCAHEMGDPSADLCHMAVIAEHDGIFYKADSGSFTTPGTAADADMTLYVNDGTLDDNSGSITLQLEICNQAVETVTHVFDFTTGTHGWTITDDGGATAAYVPGVGFKANNTDGTPPHGAMTVKTPDVGEYVFLDGSLVYVATDVVVLGTARNIAFIRGATTLAQGNLVNGAGTVNTPLAFNGLIDKLLVTLDADVMGDQATLTTITIVIQGTTDPYLGL